MKRIHCGRVNPKGPIVTASSAKTTAVSMRPRPRASQRASPEKKASQSPANWRRVLREGSNSMSDQRTDGLLGARGVHRTEDCMRIGSDLSRAEIAPDGPPGPPGRLDAL